MKTIFASLLRPVATLALAVALAAPIALSSRADAQLGRQLPSPVSAAQLEEMLRFAGLPDTTKDAALPLHEAYFARFREFEKTELDPVLSKPNDSPFDLARSVEDARKEADLRRRVFQRAAQLDAQLVEEITAVLPAEESWKSVKLRDSLARRRAAVLAPSLTFGGKPLEYTLRSAPVLVTLDPDTARIVNLSLEVYESELTRQLERYADAALARIVKAAEIREEMGLTSMPQQAEGEAIAGPGEEWFRKMREAQRRASEDITKATLRIRKLHRDGLEQIMPLVPTPEARLLRNHMMSALYPMLREKSAFDAVFEIAKTMHEKGELDDSKWHAAMDIADANELASRAIAMDMMALLDGRASEGELGVLVFDGGELGGEKSEEAEKLERLKKSLVSLETSNADTLRATLGLAAAQEGDGRGVERKGIDLGQLIVNGGGDVQVEGQIAIGVAGAGGDMIVLSGDDMADGMFSFGGFGGAPDRIARPMTRDELDALANRLGFAKDSRAVFDEIAARCAEARNIAEQELKPAKPIQTSDGGATFTITLGGPDGEAVMGGGDNSKLAEAVDKAEETMFDELKAAAAGDKTDAVEAARRARARARLLPGESGAQAIDLVVVADGAGLAQAARDRIAADLRAWDESSVQTLRTMKSELKTLIEERNRFFEDATEEVREDDGNGSVNVNRAVKIDGEMAERMQKLEEKIASTRTRVADANRQTLAGMLGALDGDDAARRALQRAFLRAEFPSTYKVARDLEPSFAKAAAIEGVTAQGKATIAAMRAEWIEARESRCEEFCLAQRKGSTASLAAPEAGMQQMQLQMREKKKLREDLEQLEATIFRKLQDALIVDVGPEKAKELGELPKRKRPAMPAIQIGG